MALRAVQGMFTLCHVRNVTRCPRCPGNSCHVPNVTENMRTEGRPPTEAERERGCTCTRVFAAPDYDNRAYRGSSGDLKGNLPVLHTGGCPFPGRPAADGLAPASDAYTCESCGGHAFMLQAPYQDPGDGADEWHQWLWLATCAGCEEQETLYVDRSQSERDTIPCEQCGTPMPAHVGPGRPRRYHSAACRQAAHRAGRS